MRLDARTDSTARPSEPPTTCVVLNSPDASPASSSRAPVMASPVSAGIAAANPTEGSSIGGSTSVTYPPPTGARLSSAIPATISASPDSSTREAPNRPTTRADRPSISTPIATGAGRKASPVADSPYPRTRCRYSAPMNWNPYIVAIISTCTAFAPLSSRERDSPSRSSGRAARAWRRVNARNRARASADSSRVRLVLRSPEPTMTYTVSISAPVTSAAPGRSAPRADPAAASGRSGASTRTAATSATTPIGRLIRKIQCQPRVWVSAPPRNVPSAPPAAPTALNTAMALVCSRPSGNSATSMPSHRVHITESRAAYDAARDTEAAAV